MSMSVPVRMAYSVGGICALGVDTTMAMTMTVAVVVSAHHCVFKLKIKK